MSHFHANASNKHALNMTDRRDRTTLLSGNHDVEAGGVSVLRTEDID